VSGSTQDGTDFIY